MVKKICLLLIFFLYMKNKTKHQTMYVAYPPRFGPKYWTIIHLTAFRIDEMRHYQSTQKKTDYDKHIPALANFLREIPLHIPCIGCVKNFEKFLKDHPVPNEHEKYNSKDHRQLFFHWSVDAHNHANQSTGKRIISYEEADKLFLEEWSAPLDTLSETYKKRLEDHAKIQQLEDELERTLKEKTMDTSDKISIAILVILSVMFFLIVRLVFFQS